MDRSSEPIRSLYVHVPFCARKCSYCAFYSEPSSGDLVNRYIHCLTCEMESVAADLRPETVFFGGGTPSLLNLRQWEQLFAAMGRLGLFGAAEWTVECNPATVSEDKARLLRDGGVNRVSMGVQSLDESLLERLGRVHTREMVFRSFDVLRRAGCENVNVDLMFAIPGQTLEMWRATLNEALALESEHLSCYEVIYEEDTPLYAQLRAGQFDINEELACAMYDELLHRAADAGFKQYEIANFARQTRLGADQTSNFRHQKSFKLQTPRHRRARDLFDNGGRGTVDCGLWTVDDGLHPSSAFHDKDVPGFACRHNVNYWRGGSFYGLGPSATSYVRGVRTRNYSNTKVYCEEIEKGRGAADSREELSALGRAGETAAFGLRMVAGWPFEQFRERTGFDLRQEWAADMSELAGQGWARQDQERFMLTAHGLRFADAAAQRFLR